MARSTKNPTNVWTPLYAYAGRASMYLRHFPTYADVNHNLAKLEQATRIVSEISVSGCEAR